jgi:hypothetical protein
LLGFGDDIDAEGGISRQLKDRILREAVPL